MVSTSPGELLCVSQPLATAEPLAYFSLVPKLALYLRRTQGKEPRIPMKDKCLPRDGLAAEQ